MTVTSNPPDLASLVSAELPYLRRYARALTGSQESGDRYAIATLEAIVAEPSVIRRDLPLRVALFNVFSLIWSSSDLAACAAETAPAQETRARWRLSHLGPETREALLLHTIEGMSFSDIAEIMDRTALEARDLVAIAHREMEDQIRGRVLIVEDEAIIALDLAGIVSGMGHEVCGIARTGKGAVALAEEARPDLVLADIQLEGRASGIDAVNEILAQIGPRPVVFVTAFPERLLTGQRPEPAFLISKPYTEEQIRSAVSQALFFATTEGLTIDA